MGLTGAGRGGMRLRDEGEGGEGEEVGEVERWGWKREEDDEGGKDRKVSMEMGGERGGEDVERGRGGGRGREVGFR